MSLADQLTRALLDAYRRAGEEVGYWGHRFRQAVIRNGGLATAKRMLLPRNAGQRKGLDALLEAGRPDLTVEQVILQQRFKALFSSAELAEARRRLGVIEKAVAEQGKERERLFPDELPLGQRFPEGSRKQVRVNAYERNRKARKACIAYHGCRCAVCDLSFRERYGEIGNGFIHVHHLRAIATITEAYQVDAVSDLVPICPNCHAMLHRTEPPLSVKQLRELLQRVV